MSSSKPEIKVRKQKRIHSNLSIVAFCVSIFIILLSVTSFVRNNAVTQNNEKSRERFLDDTSRLQTRMLLRLQSYQNAIEGARGLFNASEAVSKDEWKAYVDSLHLEANYAGLPILAFAPVFLSDDTSEFSELVKESGYENSPIHPTNTGNPIVAPILYVEPFSPNAASVIGFDIFSEPVRADAIAKAYNSGTAAMTGKITLLSDAAKSNEFGALIYVAVYKKNAPLDTEQQKIDALQGLIFAPVRMSDFMTSAIGNNGFDDEIQAVVYDTSKNAEFTIDNKMYGNQSALKKAKNIDLQTLSIAGQTWQIKYWSDKTYFLDDAKKIPSIILVSGISISVFLCGSLFLLLSSRKRAIQYANKVTEELLVERDQAIVTQKKDEAILSGIAEGLAVYDETGTVVRLNAVAEEMFGLSQADVEGQSFAKAYPVFDRRHQAVAVEDRPVARAFATGQPVTMTLYYQRRDESYFPIQTTASPLIVEGKTIGAVAIFRDVTFEIEVDKRKSEFVSLASHQLKTPIGAINWDVQLLLDGFYGPISEEQGDELNQILSMGTRMNDLVNSLLNVARIEQGAYTVNPEPTSFTDIFYEVIEEMSARLHEKSQVVNVLPSDNLPMVDMDKNLFRIIVQNLVSNASKYSPAEKNIEVAINISGENIVASVSNDGPSIPSNEKIKIFDKMYRASNSSEQDAEGSGLGLYMVKEIIKSTGGKIWFSSKNQHTVFSFSFPLTGMDARIGQSMLSV